MAFDFNHAFAGEPLSECKKFLHLFKSLSPEEQQRFRKHLDDHDLGQAIEIITLFKAAPPDDQKVALYLLKPYYNDNALFFLQNQYLDERQVMVVAKGDAEIRLGDYGRELANLASEEVPMYLRYYFDLEAYAESLDLDYAQAYGFNNYKQIGAYVILWGAE